MINPNYKDARTLNMKVVVNETGLKPDTLRAWERRYGLPQPLRTAGGHRLYSLRDVETLKWLIARQEEGLSISRAVDMWHQLQSEGQDPLEAMPIESSQTTYPAVSGAAMDGLRDEWIQSCLSFDEQQAEYVLTRAFALFPSDQVCIQVLMKGLSKIGSGWHKGDISVQQEHFASELAIRRLETLLAATPPPSIPGRILVLCPPSEEHTISPLLGTYLLRRSGRHALFLGPNVPLERLEEAISKTKPNLVILISQQLHAAANLSLIAKRLQTLDIPVAYGGRIFNRLPEIRAHIPGVFLGEDLEELPGNITQLLSRTIPQYQVEDPPELYETTLRSFQSHITDIESAVWKEMMDTGMPYPLISTANSHLARNIIAALTLGEIGFLSHEIEWITGFWHNHSIPDADQNHYVFTFADAISKVLGQNGSLISDFLFTWIDNQKAISEKS